jgi:hypothetical protein
MYKNSVIKEVVKIFCLLLISTFVYAGQGQSSMSRSGSGSGSGSGPNRIEGQVLNVTKRPTKIPHLSSYIVGIGQYGGAYHARAEVVGNQVLVFNTKVKNCDVCGGYNLRSGDVLNNMVEMNKGAVEVGRVYGGYSWYHDDSNTIGNKVKISSSTVGMYVYGGYTRAVGVPEESEARCNVVEINDSNVGFGIFGGIAEKISIGNRVTLNNVNVFEPHKEEAVVGGKVERYCGSIVSGNFFIHVSSNVISICGGIIKGNVFGGSETNSNIIQDTTMNDNMVKADSVNIMGSVYGAAASGGKVTGNNVEIHNSDIKNDIYGGYVINSGKAHNNSVLVSSVNVTGSIYGARVEGEGRVENNKVIIDSGSVKCVYGGYITKGESSSNTITVGNGRLHDIYGGYVMGAGTARDNSVLVSSVNVTGSIYGAKVAEDKSIGNCVLVKGSDVKGSVYGAYAYGGIVHGNELKITSASVVKEDVFGGRVEREGRVENNRVIIDSASVKRVYGGYVDKGESSNNTVTVDNGILYDIYGGYVLAGQQRSVNLRSCHCNKTLCI